MKIKPGDEVKYHPHGIPGKEYRGIVVWIDQEDMGISIVAPPEVRGCYECIGIEEANATLIRKYNPTSFRTDLRNLSPAELRAEIESLRAQRMRASVSKPVKADTKEGILLKRLQSLPEGVIDDLLKKVS